jgi:hypothetical protein
MNATPQVGFDRASMVALLARFGERIARYSGEVPTHIIGLEHLDEVTTKEIPHKLAKPCACTVCGDPTWAAWFAGRQPMHFACQYRRRWGLMGLTQDRNLPNRHDRRRATA